MFYIVIGISLLPTIIICSPYYKTPLPLLSCTVYNDSVVSSLRSLRISVPRAVLSGERATLMCTYDLEGTPLYSIRWYRSMIEFYRYVPKEEPPTRVFPLSGINVDVSDSDDRRVTLIGVKRDLAGEYQCEVSADAPLFHTDIKSAAMMVVEVPEQVPTVSVDRLRYSAGDRIRANCSSSLSYPAANITWFVNEQKVPGFMVSSIVTSPDGMESSSSTLELETELLGSSSSVSKLRLRCEASLFDVYRSTSNTIEIKEDRPQLASVMGHSISGFANRSPMLHIFNLVVTATFSQFFLAKLMISTERYPDHRCHYSLPKVTPMIKILLEKSKSSNRRRSVCVLVTKVSRQQLIWPGIEPTTSLLIDPPVHYTMAYIRLFLFVTKLNC
ncbi:uncharacterized protein LOC143917774 [Arctopsyche grandis]|uniref:uncharacterized protein LOC143917774 n=1 Tax=Arctopsyche grandis TaxID=121162 RepID=UPI00406D9699